MSKDWIRLGDAARLLEPDDPTKGLMFDGRIAEDFKLASGTWVSVGPSCYQPRYHSTTAKSRTKAP